MDPVNQSQTPAPLSPESSAPKSTPPYHIPIENLTFEADGTVTATYPNLTLKFPDTPAWARTIIKMNAMLDFSSNPQTLRGYYDQLLAASSTDYMAANQSYPKTRDVTSQILDPEMRATLIEMFTLRLQDEMRSTGTCPTGQAHCSEMQKFRAILAQLKE